LISWKQTISGRLFSSHADAASIRARTPLMFHVATRMQTPPAAVLALPTPPPRPSESFSHARERYKNYCILI
jgi:hypothetical protein